MNEEQVELFDLDFIDPDFNDDMKDIRDMEVEYPFYYYLMLNTSMFYLSYTILIKEVVEALTPGYLLMVNIIKSIQSLSHLIHSF